MSKNKPHPAGPSELPRRVPGASLYPQEALDAAAAELARQQHGGPADPDDIRLAADVLGAAWPYLRERAS